MTLEQLKENIRNLVGNAQPEVALGILGNWAVAQGDEQLQNDIAQIKAELSTLQREAMLLLTDHATESMRRGRINYRILELMGTIREKPEDDRPTGGIDIQPIRQALLEDAFNQSDYATLLDLLDAHFAGKPTPQYSMLKQTIQHALNQGFMPPPATQQGMKLLIHQLKNKG